MQVNFNKEEVSSITNLFAFLKKTPLNFKGLDEMLVMKASMDHVWNLKDRMETVIKENEQGAPVKKKGRPRKNKVNDVKKEEADGDKP